MNEQELRDHAVAAARPLAGLGSNPASAANESHYLDFVTPGSGADREDLIPRPNAALVTAAYLRGIGIAVPGSLTATPGVRGLVSAAIARLSTMAGLHATAGEELQFRFAGLRGATTEVNSHSPSPSPVERLRPADSPALRALERGGVTRAAETPVAHVAFEHITRAFHQVDLTPAPDRDAISTDTAPLAYAAAEDLRLLIDWVKRMNAWTGGVSSPKPGDIVVSGSIGVDARVAIVTEVGADNTRFNSVDAGSRDAQGYPVIVARAHALRDNTDVTLAGGGLPCEVQGLINIARLYGTLTDHTGAPPVLDVTPQQALETATIGAALSVVGLGANPDSPTARERYGDLIAPGETPEMREDMMSMSGCALVAAGVLRLIGISAPELEPPYRIGHAISRLVALATRAGAWVRSGLNKVPNHGDIVVVGGEGLGGPEHVFIITSITQDGDVWRVESVDGGQRDAERYQLIQAKQRHFSNNKDTLDSGLSLGEQRGIVGFIDVGRLTGFLTGQPSPPVVIDVTQVDKWESFAASSGEPYAGKPLTPTLLDTIRARRSAVPREPNMSHVTALLGGFMYTGRSDHAHVQYLDARLRSLALASSKDARRIEAFRAILPREGMTTAINSYDNQLITWGAGFGGLGLLGDVMDRLFEHPEVVSYFHDVGVRFNGDGYDVVDLNSSLVVSGMKPALKVISASQDLLYALIDVARAVATRDAVTDAQLAVFAAHSAKHAGDNEIATQALFNFITHLKHWAPSYAINAIPWAVTQLPGTAPSAERDQQLAPLLGKYFYARAQGHSWIPAFSQMKTYVGHMRDDGLDCTQDPWFAAASPTDLPTL